MSNSKLVVYTHISPHKTVNRNHTIDTVSIHCVVGQCTVERLGDIFDGTRKCSANYGVSYDGKIGMYVEEKDRSWCTSSSSNDNRAITIEVASDTKHPYAVRQAAYFALIDLLVDICERNNIEKLLWRGDKSLIGQVNKQNMTVHRWFANKACPGEYLYSRHAQIAEAVNKVLSKQEDDEMDQATFNKMFSTAMLNYRNELRDNDSGKWSKEAREFAEQKNLFVGSGTTVDGQPNMMWEDMLTREQAAVLFYRFAKLLGQV